MKKNKNYEWKLELNRRKYISVRTEISNFFENPPIHEQQQLRVDKIVFQANDQAVETAVSKSETALGIQL